jgi:hypothetical protein
MDTLALSSGFNTPAMDVRITQSPLEIAWTTPRDAAFVACAVFTCNPVINTHKRIANAAACMLGLYVTDASRSSIPIDMGHRQPTEPTCAPDGKYACVTDFVAAGCWAFDSNTIIAASDLMELPVADLTRVAPEIPNDATCLRDDDTCYDAAHGFFGACVSGRCEPRCTSAADCEVAGMQLLGQPASPVCSWECRTMPNSLAGVCAPLTP